MRKLKKLLKGFGAFGHSIMEQAKKEVKKDLEEQKAIREYLLGALSNKAEMRRIEKKILLDDDFVEKLSVAEDQLIDEYLDGSLADSEQKSFNQFFLTAPERKEKLRLIRDLRKYAANSETQTVGQFPKEKSGFFDWRKLINLPSFRLAAAALLVLVAGFVVWRAVFYQSDVDKGLAQLRIAYRGQRPTESRSTANFDYAELPPKTRGNKQTITDQSAYNIAKNLLSSAAASPTDSDAHHALGLSYLADKKFEEALNEFKIALKFAPNNAKLHSDIGAIYLEKARIAEDEDKGDEFTENLELSLEYIDRALELDGNLLEALFNKALLLQKKGLINQAREAWGKYLEKDSTSPWADEARKQLQKIELQKSQNLSAADLEKAFLNAFRQGNDDEARQLISRNREIITEKYLPQRLAMSLVEASGAEKEEFLKALIYAGELEKTRIGDSFAADMGNFYAKVSDTNLKVLKEAQEKMRSGLKSLLDGKIKEALVNIQPARELFLQIGNVWEAKISEYLIVYCFINSYQIKESLLPSEEIIAFCRQKNYKWLLSNALLWYGTAQRVNKQRPQAKISYRESLDLAVEMEDSLLFQSINLELAKLSKFVRQDRSAIRYLHDAFKNGDAPGGSLRQKWRNYSDSAEILANVKYYNLAKAVSLENIAVAEELKNPLLRNFSELDVGIIYSRLGDYNEARNWFALAKKNAESVVHEGYRKEILGKSSLELGHLEIKLGNYSQAANFYSEALGYVEESGYYLYEIQRSRLLAQISLGNEAEIEKQIVETIGLAENYREQILEEQESNSFFDGEQTVYDIAIANDFNHGKYEQAYNYLETSNSRSLLDWLKKGVDAEEKKKEIEFTFKKHAQALPLNEIRSQMPDRAQILQYAVLENKILIFAFSKDNFKVVSSEINSEELNKKVTAYVQLVSTENRQKQEEAKVLARELYDLLLSPIVNQLDPSREICLIPNKILFYLPFAALTAPDGKPFLKQFNFVYAPSANVFLLFTENARQKSALTNESLLSVGNPRFDREEFKDLENLPEAEKEAQEIKQFYTASPPPLIGSEATKTAVLDSLKNAEVINFAGHYIVRDGEPLASGLLLTKIGNSDSSEDGILTNAELIDQKLPKLKLVVLSACQTGVERYYKGEGLVGLSRTFLAAGAPLVVASQWKVDSGAAAQLIKNFHRFRRQEKLSTTAALRRAQLEMLESPDERLRQPYFWAAFATYGGYAEF